MADLWSMGFALFPSLLETSLWTDSTRQSRRHCLPHPAYSIHFRLASVRGAERVAAGGPFQDAACGALFRGIASGWRLYASLQHMCSGNSLEWLRSFSRSPSYCRICVHFGLGLGQLLLVRACFPVVCGAHTRILSWENHLLAAGGFRSDRG